MKSARLFEPVKFDAKAAVLLLVSLATILPFGLGGRDPLSAITLVMLMTLGLFVVWRLPKVQPLAGEPLIWGWLGLYAWSWISMLWSINRFQTFVWNIELTTAMAAFVVAYHLKDRWQQWWIKGYFWITIGFSLFGGWLYLTQDYNRLTSTFYWANPFAAFFTPAVLLAWWYWCKEKDRLALVAASVGAAAVLLTISRISYLFLAVALAVLAYKIRGGGLVTYKRLGLVVALALVLAGAVSYGRSRIGGHEVLSAGTRFAEAAKGQSVSLDDRWLYLRGVANIWRDFPVAGTGAGTYRTSSLHYQPRVITYSIHPHNFYAQVLSDLGLVGFLFVLAFLWGVVQVSKRALKDPKAWPLVAAMGLAVVHLGFDFDTSYPVFWPLIGSLIGLVYVPAKRSPTSPAQRNLASMGYAGAVLGVMVVLLLPAWSRYQSRQNADWGAFRQELLNYPDASQSYRQAHLGLVYDPDTLLAQGINHFLQATQFNDNKEANLRQADQLAQAASKLDPWDSQPWLLRARVASVQKDLQAAESFYLRAISMSPYENPDYYNELAFLYFGQGRLDESLKFSSTAINQYPDAVLANRNEDKGLGMKLSELYRARAQVLVAKGQTAAAKADLERSLKLGPTNAQSLQLLKNFKF